jgi:hypothetical protein
MWEGARTKSWVQSVRRLMRAGAAPDLLIVGAQKAGTTSLYNYLNAIPGFSGAQRKEVRFFNDEGRYAKGTKWYERFFGGDKNDVHFEATPEYLYHPDVPVRIHAHYPGCRIVIVLREPVARAFSAWNMYQRWAKEGFVPHVLWKRRRANPLFSLFFDGAVPSFEECIEQESPLLGVTNSPLEPSIIRRGLYAEQIQRFLNVFGPEQVLVVGFQRLIKSPSEVLDNVISFAVGQRLPQAGAEVVEATSVFNEGRYSGKCPKSIANKLNAFYLPHNQRLADLLGGSLPDW